MNALERIVKMANEGNDSVKLAPLGNITKVSVNKKGIASVEIKFPDAEFVKKFMSSSLVGGLLYVDRNEFEKAREQ